MTAEIPALKGFTTYYGVPVSDIGEEGALIALGHHDKRRALAAMNRHARTDWGLRDLYDERLSTRRDAFEDIAVQWATEKTVCDRLDDDDHDPGDCGECIELAEASWWLDCGDKQVPGSFPVMYWSS